MSQDSSVGPSSGAFHGLWLTTHEVQRARECPKGHLHQAFRQRLQTLCNPWFTGQSRSPYCLGLRTIFLLVQCLAMRRRLTWEQRRVMERPYWQHAHSHGSDHPPVLLHDLKDFAVHPLKLTYSCLGNFETSTCLLKQNSEDCTNEKFHTADFSRVWLCLKKKIQRAEAN